MQKLLTDMRPDDYSALVIARAREFTATIYSGQGAYSTARYHADVWGTAHTALAAAGASASHMNSRSDNGRRAIVYAINPEGRQVMVPEHLWRAVLADELAAADAGA
jgi:hypothetical protein